MILIDTSIWIDHFRHEDPILFDLLRREQALVHPHVIGELALGSLKPRAAILRDLRDQLNAHVARDAEVQAFIEGHTLYGTGIGYVDAHLLASTLLTPDTKLWTRDKRLLNVANRLGVDAKLD